MPLPQGRNDVTTLSLHTIHLAPSIANSYFRVGCVRLTRLASWFYQSGQNQYKIVDAHDVAGYILSPIPVSYTLPIIVWMSFGLLCFRCQLIQEVALCLLKG